MTSHAAMSLLDLDYSAVENINPTVLHFPDGQSARFTRWATVMRDVSQWLYDNGHIISTKQSGLLDADVPATAKGKPYNHVKLADNIFINLNYTKLQTVARIQKLLTDVGYDPHGFTIDLPVGEAEAVTGPNEATFSVQYSITAASLYATPIQDLDHQKIKHVKPTKLHFPDATSTSLTSWAAMMREIAKWLHSHGYIRNSKQSDLLEANIPTTSKGRPYRHHVRLASNLFINLHYDRKYTLQRVQKLLTDIGHRPHRFTVILQDEGSGIHKQPNEAKASVQSDITNVSSPTTSIQGIDYQKIKHAKPTRLHFPDGASTKLDGWSPMMRKVAKWLHTNGHIKNPEQSDILDANVPTTSKGKTYNHVRLADNLFINLQYNGKYTLQRVKKLLQDVEHEPDRFKLAFEGEQA